MTTGEKALKAVNLKVTPQRLELLKLVYRGDRTTLRELYQSMRAVMPSISLATVYKTCNTLCDMGILYRDREGRYSRRTMTHLDQVASYGIDAARELSSELESEMAAACYRLIQGILDTHRRRDD